jgi:glycosyltransferase involved in cell wall biosynthesis
MRILYIARELDDAGSFFVLEGLFGALRKRGHVVELLVLQAERAGLRNGSFAATNGRAAPAATTTPPRRPSLLRRLRRFAFELAPATKIFFWDGLRSIAPQLRAIRSFRPDLIVDRDNWVTILLARWKRIPCLSHWDGLFEAEAAFGRKRSWDFALMLPLARAVLRRYGRHFAVVTPAVRDHHVALGFAPERFTVLDNGVDVERFRPGVARHPISESLRGKIVVGFVGSFRPWHRIDEFLGVIPPILESRPDVVFLFAGGGPDFDKVKALADDEKFAGRVLLLGRLPHEEIPSVVACFDIGIVPFTTYSTSNLKIYEYMALGAATVAPGYDSVRRVIADGKDGVTFEPDDGEAMRRSLLRLIEDAPLRRSIGAAARRKMVERFTWDHCAARFLEACAAAGAPAAGAPT